MTGRRRRLLVGGYSPPRGAAEGIAVVEHDLDAGSLQVVGTAVRTGSPSALAAAPDGRTVFAVEEDDPGRVHSFRRRSDDTLDPLSSRDSGGTHPCHLLVHPSGRHLFTANYSGRTVAVHPIGTGGELGEASDLRRFEGHGADPDRQDASHPHMVTVRPGSDEVAVVDLGADRVHRLLFDERTGRFGADLPALEVPPGCGPRQLVFARDGRAAFVLGELDSALYVADWTGPAPRVTSRQPGLSGPIPSGNLAATLVLSGAQLFASQRGADVVTVFDAGPRPRLTAELPAAGRGPRHIAVAGGVLYVANELSGTVAAVPLDDPSAVLTVAAPSATFVLPI
jgi:6-phosphogluconolactonase